jgi:Ni/Co efflux regulator RcnB
MSLAACAAMSGAAQAYTLTCPEYGYRCYRTPSPDEAAKKAYDHAWTYHRVHGAWPDGREHAAWRRGQILPLGVTGDAPAVDWRAAGLYAPKAGYRWLDVGGDFLLVGDVSRLIAAIVLPTS